MKLDLDWKLDPKVNILIGINGSGKTTVLNFLFFCFNQLEQPYFSSSLKTHFTHSFRETLLDFNHHYFFWNKPLSPEKYQEMRKNTKEAFENSLLKEKNKENTKEDFDGFLKLINQL